MTEPANRFTQSEEAELLIAKLDSLIDGVAAAEGLIAMGTRAIPWLERYLLGPARTVALPRCRAAHALGELGAWQALSEYFRGYRRPQDPAVLFAEDAVRSAAALELARWKCDEAYAILLAAARDRVTGGLIRALSGFGRPESIPVLFSALEDDLCREDAREALRRAPDLARAYAILSLRDAAGPSVYVTSALRRRRATLQLLRELRIDPEEWPPLRQFLGDHDPDAVIATAAIGLAIAPPTEYPAIIAALFRISQRLNWVQEDEVSRLVGEQEEIAREHARQLVEQAVTKGDTPDWLVSRWRILRHLLGEELFVQLSARRSKRQTS